jgi:hypothetical protein
VAYAYGAASWLVSTFQLSGTPDLHIYKPNNIITSILPRQEERREAEESERGGEWSGVERAGAEVREEARERRGSVRTHTGEHKRERVRGGCLGAEGR